MVKRRKIKGRSAVWRAKINERDEEVRKSEWVMEEHGHGTVLKFFFFRNNGKEKNKGKFVIWYVKITERDEKLRKGKQAMERKGNETVLESFFYPNNEEKKKIKGKFLLC